MKRREAAFKPESKYRALPLAFSYGLYKGVSDNDLA